VCGEGGKLGGRVVVGPWGGKKENTGSFSAGVSGDWRGLFGVHDCVLRW